MEFTIEDGKLYMLQTRNGKRTAAAALKIAVDLVDEGMICRGGGRADAWSPSSWIPCCIPQFDAAALKKAAAHRQGPACLPRRRLRPGGFHRRATPKAWPTEGEKVVLVRLETSPEDIEGMDVVPGHPDRARRHDLPRGGCGPRHGHLLRLRLRRDQDRRGRQTVSPWAARPSRRATISPSTAPPATSTAKPSPPWRPPSPAISAASWSWADKVRNLKVRTNADNPRGCRSRP